MKNPRSQKGFTLIETLVVLGLGVVAITIAMSLFSSTSEKGNVGQEVKNFGTLAGLITNIYGGEPTYAGLTNTVVTSSSGLPDYMRGSGSTITHSWGGTITIGTANSDANYTITYNDVPQQVCVDFVSGTYQSLQSTTVNGTSVTSVAGAATACNVAANDIVFTGR